MQLTLKGDYAIRVVVELAGGEPGVAARTDDLGRRTDVPRAYLTKIIQALAHAGLVRTRRGTGGGVTLLEPPESITLRRIIEAVEGPIALNRCVIRRGLCSRDSTCPVHPVWARLQGIVTRELESVRVQDLVELGRHLTRTRTREATSC